jgi:DNA-binding response OmpR family regulator
MYALLIAEDPDDIAIYSMVLQRAGLAVTTAKSLDKAIQNWSERASDIILLALASQSPEDQVRQIRTETLAPLIIVVDSVDEARQADLLNLGSDLVIGSTFNTKLLIAQIGVLLRRANSLPASSLPTLNAPGLNLDPMTRSVEIDGKATQRLTHLEFRLLYTLLINRNQIVPTETIVERVWGYSGRGDRDLVRGLVSRLRVKVEGDPHKPQYILTEPGIGYSFRVEEEK